MTLSNTMPELTETELRHKGPYTVEWYDERLSVTVAARYQSVAAFIERNGLPDTDEYRKTVFRNLGRHRFHSDHTKAGHYVRILT